MAGKGEGIPFQHVNLTKLPFLDFGLDRFTVYVFFLMKMNS